ncbi:hypothetical protein [Acidovorax sp. FG27]|uniref:hypothetical protein n=1 Tax=Acidovorax sp. FG27 TaxID=3133652 RepID=UPI0030E7E202
MLAFHPSNSITARRDADADAMAAAQANTGLNGARCGMAYWPARSMDAFLLRMAAHGRCVSAAMMLGDRRYAVEQLEHAWSLPEDVTLQALADELAPYFAGRSPFARATRN